jgi:hypothetical protein
MRLRCANRISIFLRSRRDCSKASVSASERATSRACSWMSRGILRDGFLRAALRFERAYIAVELAGAIQERLALVHCAARSKPLPAGALVNVVCRVISEVPTREGAIVPLRLVEHRNMGRDTFFLNQPVQHWSRPVGGISDKPLRLKAEALLCSFDHGLCRADLGLPNGARGLDVNDDAELHVDEIVVGVSKECRSLMSAGPLGRGIGWRTNFGTTSLAAPHAVSSRVARYSFTARLDLLGSRSLRQSCPAIERCLLASAAIRLASTATPSPPTRPAAMHASKTRSNMWRKTSPSRKRSLRARENAE